MLSQEDYIVIRTLNGRGVYLKDIAAEGFELVGKELKAVNRVLQAIDKRLEDIEIGHTATLMEHQRRLDVQDGELRLVKGGKHGGRSRATPR